MELTKSRIFPERPVLWGIFILFLIVSAYSTSHHELWGDEIHSWNISKGSNSFFDLIINSRYEGHPPVWYTILWTISKFSHNPAFIQAAQFFIGGLVVFMVLFASSYPLTTKLLIPFGYFFLFEYGIFTRNYAIGVLLAFCICSIVRKHFKGKTLLYYVLVFLLSNTHLLGLVIAGSLHLYFLIWNFEQRGKINTLILHIIAGALVLLPASYFILPPSDGELNVDYWLNRWNNKQLVMTAQSPLRSFIPMPAWWEYNFWNTQFLLQAHSKHNWLKFISPLVSLTTLGLLCFVLKENKKCLILFLTNLLLSFLISLVIFPLTCARYAGFIYIGFLAAYWLYSSESQNRKQHKWIMNSLLVIQLIAGVFSVSKDIQLPFSNLHKVNKLINKVPGTEIIVTDYWTLNAVSTFVNKPFYCVDLQKEKTFIMWDSDITKIENTPHRYLSGIKNLFQNKNVEKIFMISLGSPKNLYVADSQLTKSYKVELIGKVEGAIEKGSNLYLYQISN